MAMAKDSARLAGLHELPILLQRKEGEDEGPTQILDVLVRQISQRTAGLLCARLLASPPRLVDHDAVRDSGGDEGEAVRKPGHSRVVVHAEP